MGRPSDNLQPAGKRRPGEKQLTKDNYDDSDDEGQGVDPGTWGKADAATMARRKVVKVRRGAAPPADQAEATAPAEAAAAGSNPFAGVSLTGASAEAPAANPFAGVSLVAPAAGKADDKAASQQAAPKPANGADTAVQPTEAAADAKAQEEPSEAPASNADKEASQDTKGAADKAPSTEHQQADQQAQQDGQKAADGAEGSTAEKKADDRPAAGSGGLFGSSAATGFGGFGGFGGLAANNTGFGGGGFGGFAAAAKDGPSGGSLFGSYTAPQPGSLFGSVPAFGAAAAGKAKDVEEGGGDGDAQQGDENGQEVFGGPEVTPVVQLNEVPKQTGEEDDNSVFSAEGKLYEFVNSKDWKERGRGDLRLNVHRTTHRARLVMRQKGSQRLLLNANLYPQMSTSKMVGGKGATFSAVNAAPPVPGEEQGKAEGSGKQEQDAAADAAAESAAAAASMKTYAFKAKADEINAFLAAVDKYKASSREDAAGETDASKQGNPDSW